MKKNIFLRIALVMLVTVIATTGVFVGSGTFAKYIASADATSSARVAKFEVRVNNTTFSQTGGAKFGTTITLGDWQADAALLDTTGAESADHVKPVDGTIIAPGTGGRLTLTLKNASEVAVKFTLNTTNSKLSGTAAAALDPKLKWGTAARPTGTLATALSTINGAADMTLAPGTSASPTTKTVDLYWFWPFGPDAQDATDTTLGVNAVAADQTAIFTFAVEAAQVD